MVADGSRAVKAKKGKNAKTAHCEFGRHTPSVGNDALAMAIQVRLEPAVLTITLWKAHYTTFSLPVGDSASSIFDRNELKLGTP